MLSCHLCARSQKAQNQCMQCGSADILYFSAGTKGIEQEVAQLFPNASIARFDLDVAAKDTIQRKLHELQTGTYDIIIGTQVISKGFDLPKLSVVGVLNADSGFTLPDYRSEEITFQQLYQVTGRVGRGHSDSNYIIQTRQPNHPVIEAALQRNWQTFFEYELSKRQLFRYPPFTHIAVANITKARQATAEKSARQLTQILESYSRIQVLGPSPSYHETTHGGYTWQVLIKSASRSALTAALLAIPTEWVIDIDPTSVL
jgi:primosomal protein N' (replication factor Y)